MSTNHQPDPDVMDAMEAASPNRGEPSIDPDFARALEKPLRFDKGQPIIETHDDVKRYARLIWNTPSMKIGGAQSETDVAVALLHGMEAGLTPTMCVKNVMITNGRPAIWGDCLIGLCYASAELAGFEETFDEATETATCTVTRLVKLWNGESSRIAVTRTFSRADADTAGLTGRGVHRTYPTRMLQQRARGFALRDAFADRLAGLHVAEDAQAIPFDPSQMRAARKGTGEGLIEAAEEDATE